MLGLLLSSILKVTICKNSVSFIEQSLKRLFEKLEFWIWLLLKSEPEKSQASTLLLFRRSPDIPEPANLQRSKLDELNFSCRFFNPEKSASILLPRDTFLSSYTKVIAGCIPRIYYCHGFKFLICWLSGVSIT